jgi:hypothetical protein
MNPRDLARVLRRAADELDAIESERRAERRGWTDQSSSPLGRRRHVARVRARIAAGQGGAAQIGRRYVLSQEALDEELTLLSGPKKVEQSESGPDALRRRLGLVGGVK